MRQLSWSSQITQTLNFPSCCFVSTASTKFYDTFSSLFLFIVLIETMFCFFLSTSEEKGCDVQWEHKNLFLYFWLKDSQMRFLWLLSFGFRCYGVKCYCDEFLGRLWFLCDILLNWRTIHCMNYTKRLMMKLK